MHGPVDGREESPHGEKRAQVISLRSRFEDSAVKQRALICGKLHQRATGWKIELEEVMTLLALL